MAESSEASKPAGTGATYKAPTPASKPNPIFKMMGLPNLPKKLPGRNWMIFWAITASISAAVIYDKREKKRATAKWREVVAPLSQELIGSPNQLPRKLSIYLEAPPGDGLRVAQDHFIEYAKPVLAASGLDWEFIQGREEGDVRAAVAEKIRRQRRKTERPNEEVPETDETRLELMRGKMGLPEYQGTKGDVIFGLHTWKEYVRGLHEGWLGPLDPPAVPEAKPEVEAELTSDGAGEGGVATDSAEKPEEKPEEKKEEENKKPERPPQPPPYNAPSDYAEANLPPLLPFEFSPANPIVFPHRLGFRHTFVRLNRFFNRRKLADEVGREMAIVCFAAASREWRPAEDGWEQQQVLKHEEKDWPKGVWKEETEEVAQTDDASPAAPAPAKEHIWTRQLVIDSRLAERMRRFELTPEIEARAAAVVVPETEIEGWFKGGLRSIWRWGVDSWTSKPMRPNVGDVNDE